MLACHEGCFKHQNMFGHFALPQSSAPIIAWYPSLKAACTYVVAYTQLLSGNCTLDEWGWCKPAGSLDSAWQGGPCISQWSGCVAELPQRSAGQLFTNVCSLPSHDVVTQRHVPGRPARLAPDSLAFQRGHLKIGQSQLFMCVACGRHASAMFNLLARLGGHAWGASGQVEV